MATPIKVVSIGLEWTLPCSSLYVVVCHTLPIQKEPFGLDRPMAWGFFFTSTFFRLFRLSLAHVSARSGRLL